MQIWICVAFVCIILQQVELIVIYKLIKAVLSLIYGEDPDSNSIEFDSEEEVRQFQQMLTKMAQLIKEEGRKKEEEKDKDKDE